MNNKSTHNKAYHLWYINGPKHGLRVKATYDFDLQQENSISVHKLDYSVQC
ncbi:hypothetical protein SAMN05216474_0357 [Lishizhenia tianjinensis]|uniref:Uncharacterized protein n=1 Tax=Lishizhenia tianjinensis TaxID=477690 RepID=A0A1I6XP68_9FLAO|nr:hypothetical protein SAMN05216474_0357 [Lishizhenia tianjinensis]